MAVPKYDELMKPLLAAVKDGEVYKIKDVTAVLAEQLNLSAEDLAEMLPSGRQTVFKNRVGWAKTYLKKAGLLDSPARATIVITEAGKKVVAENPEKRSCFSEYPMQRLSSHLHHISFDLKKGEILGIYGLVGAGRTETLECLFGARTISEGEITYNGHLVRFNSPKEAMKANFALVTEERKVSGMFDKCDLTYNTCICNLDKYRNGPMLSNKKMTEATKIEIQNMHVKCMSPKDMISSLSGGNQQKVIVGKWLERSPDVFLMDEPTRGIDILAKYQIYELMISLASQGKSIIMVSSEMPELLGVCDRILVMSNGRVSGIVNANETTQEEIMHLSAKYLSVTGGVNNANQIKEKV